MIASKHLFALPLLASFVVLLAGCSKQDSTDVAKVNGEAISLNEFVSYLERKPGVTVTMNNGATIEGKVPANMPLGYQAMRDLIGRRLLLKFAKEDGVAPTDADIDKEIAFQTQNDPKFLSKLQAQGMSQQDIRADIAVDLAQQAVITKGVTVADSEVDTYIKQHPEQFQVSPTASLYWVVADSEALKDKIDKALAGGADFRVVAAKMSLAPYAKQTNGRYPETDLGRMPSELRNMVEKTNELQTTPWRKAGNQWAKFYVEHKLPGSKVAVTDLMRTRIKRAIAVQKGRLKNDLDRRLAEGLKNADVKITDPAFQQIWKDSISNLSIQPASR